MTKKVLIAEKNIENLKALIGLFNNDEETDFLVLTAQDGNIAVDKVWLDKPDLVIVGSELEHLSGIDVLGILRKNSPTNLMPVIILADQNQPIEHELKAFKLGADDYIKTPYNKQILLARAKSVIQRSIDYKSDVNEDMLESGAIKVNMSSHIVTIEGKEIELTPKEFALLHLFMTRKNHLLNRELLSGVIWEHEYYTTSQTIDRHVSNLRKKIGKEARRIQTVHSFGYKFVD